MTVIEQWNVEGRHSTPDELSLVSGPPIAPGEQVRLVRGEVHDALAEQLRGAVDALREVRKAALVGLTANDQTARLYKGALARVVELAEPHVGGR